jgi:hypothetical protein
MARGLLFCLLLIAALAGCAQAATTTPVADQPTALTSPDDCIEIVVSSSAAPPEDLRTTATEVVHGTFDGFGPSRWNTPDGHRPSKLEAQQDPARLIRSLLFTPIGQIVGTGASLDRAMVPGGVSGCDRVSFDPVAPLTPGDGYVFFFMPVTGSEGSMAGDLMLIGAWPVLDDGSVSTTVLAHVPFEEARDWIVNGPKPEPS